MSYLHAHPLPAWTTADDLQLSRRAAQAYAHQQAVAELRAATRTPRPVRFAVWGRARRAVRRLRPA